MSDLPGKMKACQVVEFKKPYQINEVDTPQEVGEYDLLVKTAVASLCHTDFMVLNGVFDTKLPHTGSHEGTGKVVKVGSKVNNFKVGDRIMAGIPKSQCGSCFNCVEPEHTQYCSEASMVGVFNAQGAFADYFVADSRTSCLVPDAVNFTDAAPLACAGITIYRALLVAEAEKGDYIGLVGAGGGLGHLGIQMGNAMGYKIIAVDARDEALELCKKAGAETVLDAREGKEAVVKKVKEITGEGCHATINLSEHETAAPLSCAITRMHQKMIQISQPDIVNIPFQELIFRDIRVVSSLIANQSQSQDMLSLVGKAGIKVETNVFDGLDKIHEAVELAHGGKMKGKAVVVVDKSQV